MYPKKVWLVAGQKKSNFKILKQHFAESIRLPIVPLHNNGEKKTGYLLGSVEHSFDTQFWNCDIFNWNDSTENCSEVYQLFFFFLTMQNDKKSKVKKRKEKTGNVQWFQ